MAGSALEDPPGKDGGDVSAVLARIDARLSRLERSLEPVLALASDVPNLVATAGDILDEKAARLGDVEARLNALVDVAERLSRPETLGSMKKALDVFESAPDAVATLADVADELMGELAAEGIDFSRVVGDGKRLLVWMLRLTTAPQLRQMLDPDAIESLGQLAAVLVEARERPGARVGLFGALRAMRNEDVQRAVGFLLDVAAGFGRVIERETANPNGAPRLQGPESRTLHEP
jgi:uncharacterized protein YjgD (DUF1641 family)